MSVEIAIASALNSLVSNRVYPMIATQGTAKPYIVYTEISAVPGATFCDTEDDAESVYQIDVYHENRTSLRVLRKQVRAAIKTIPQFESISGWTSDYETDTRLHRCLLTVRFYEHEADL